MDPKPKTAILGGTVAMVLTVAGAVADGYAFALDPLQAEDEFGGFVLNTSASSAASANMFQAQDTISGKIFAVPDPRTGRHQVVEATAVSSGNLIIR